MTLKELSDLLIAHLGDIKAEEKKFVKRLNEKDDKAPYFGLIHPKEEDSGPYSDFSFVVFPDDAKDVKQCMVGLVVGSSGFRNDYDIARMPWWRREFMTLEDAVCKNRFTDLESTLDIFDGFKNVESVYGKVIQAARQVTLDGDEGLNVLYDWLDTYGYLRGWLKKPAALKVKRKDPDVKALLNKYKYVVLQGAPGVGKTYTAMDVASKYDLVHFIQFHAETTYADFVEGIEPNTDGAPGFKHKEGKLLAAINDALASPQKSVLLIVDEINRANLANVLGPVFFLFEHGANNRTKGLNICGENLTKLPENLHVLGTMNSADRSLAVVDFALRRRFIWVTLRPKPLKGDFAKEAFDDMDMIFRRYADDSELALQPGQSYFIGTDSTDIEQRMRYELLTLIKEYLNEGFLRDAESAFASYFAKYAGGATLYE